MLINRFLRHGIRKNSSFSRVLKEKYKLPEASVDWKSIISNADSYRDMLIARKNHGMCTVLDEILHLWSKRNEYENDILEKRLSSLALQLPNSVHPDVQNYEGDFKLVKEIGTKKEYPFKPLIGSALLEEKDLLRMSHLNLMCGERSYYFVADLVKLEEALIDYTLQKLIDRGFRLISVPDILPEGIIERSGMPTQGERTQIYRLDPEVHGPGWCLSGTSEIAIAAFLANKQFSADQLPMYYAAVSRCYRAEISLLASEKGIYRVHQFTKVEMFGLCLPHQTDDTFKLFCQIQEDLFSSYDIHYRVIDMSPHELGHHAYRKYDIEAWMPGMNKYGEISSCSNCIDYQSRRLNIKCENQFVHTLNGTACAIPRTINAICETHQIDKGRVEVPPVLQPFMGFDVIGMKRGPKTQKITTHAPINRNTKSPT